MSITYYYDESEHSRKLTLSTFQATQYVDNFTAVIVGINGSNSDTVEKEYAEFEGQYKKLYSITPEDELKSTVLRNKKYKRGFATFKRTDSQMVTDLISLFKRNNCSLYWFCINKLEYLIYQLIRPYSLLPWASANAMRYSLTKLLTLYRPDNVYSAMYESGEKFVKEVRTFLLEQLSKNGEKEIKAIENKIINEILFILEKVDPCITLEWNYEICFDGFKKYLDEIDTSASEYELIIDREGYGATKDAANRVLGNVAKEGDSKEYVGLRVADFFAGILSSFMNARSKAMVLGGRTPYEHNTLLDSSWFGISSNDYDLYCNLYTLISEPTHIKIKHMVDIIMMKS